MSITPIGSCRITNPLRRGQDIFGYALNRTGVYGYCHSSSEAIQMVRVLTGQIRVPDALWPLVSRSELDRQAHESSDVYVVEISSAKSISIDGWSVQLNYLTSYYPDVLSDPAIAKGFWTAVDTDDQQDIDAYLARLDVAGKDVLRRVRRKLITRADVLADMTYLQETLPNVIFVTHVNAAPTTGEQIDSRARLIADVRACAAELGARVYDPTDAMTFVGQPLAMAEDSAGLAHFKPGFEEVVAHDLAHILDLPLEEENTDQTARDAISTLYCAAKVRQAHPAKSRDILNHLAQSRPDLAAPALMTLALGHPAEIQFDTSLTHHLTQAQKLQLWALSGGAFPNVSQPVSDEQLSTLIQHLLDQARWDDCLRLVTSQGNALGQKSLNALDAAFDAAVPELLQAQFVTAVLTHDRGHQGAKGALSALRDWMQAQDLSKADLGILEKVAAVNAYLPAPVSTVDLAVSRAHFRAGRYADALVIGLRVHKSAPSNLTLLIMLMRAAVRIKDHRLPELARRVLSLAEPGSGPSREAREALDTSKVTA